MVRWTKACISSPSRRKTSTHPESSIEMAWAGHRLPISPERFCSFKSPRARAWALRC
jgi:hypothetical protein